MGNKQTASNAAVRALLTLLGERRDAEVLGLAPGELRGRKIKKSLLEEFEGKCAYCQVALDDEFDVDHIVPINQQDLGMHMYGNLAPACKTCNKNKRGLALPKYLEDFHPESAAATYSFLTGRAAKWGANLDSNALREIIMDFYQDISRQVLEKAAKALKLLPAPESATKKAAAQIQRKADYDFSEIAKDFPVGARVRAELDGKVGEVIDYSLEGDKGKRKPHVKFFVAEENKAYRRSPFQIKVIS